MASINRHHGIECAGGACGCPYRLDYRPLGLRGPRRRLFFATKKAAEKHLAETSTKVSRGEYLEPAKIPTFADASEAWFASKTDRRPSHVADLRSRLDRHILPRFGSERLDRITVGAIEKLRNDLRAAGYAPRTINTIIRITGSVFRSAIRRGEATANPVERIERTFVGANELKLGDDEGISESDAVSPNAILSPSEIRLLLDASTPGYYRTLFTAAFITGMRSGEMLALRWGDLEFGESRHAKIHVRRTLSWARLNRGEPVRPRFYPPKTKSGIRAITIPAGLAAALKVWKLQSPPSELDLVFPHTDGQPNCRDRILRCGLYPALRRAGLRQVNFHSLRHACASALIATGAPVTEVQHRLGHRDPAITLKVYGHWFKGVETDTADRLSATVLGNLASPDAAEKKSAKSGHWNGATKDASRVSA